MLLWRDQMNVIVKSFSKSHIDAVINFKALSWRFTGFLRQPLTLSQG